MKKIIIPGMVAGALMLVIGMVVSQIASTLFPVLNSEYVRTGMFRPWSDPLMGLYFLYPFVLGLVLAWVWTKTKDLLGGGSDFRRGKKFGLIYWIAAGLPGMLMTYASFQVSLLMVFTWSLSGFFEAIVAGWIFAKMVK